MERVQRNKITRLGDLTNGFTLLELLVTISVIALLVSLLLPSLAKAKSNARAIQCKATLKRLSLGIYLYVDQYEVYPPDYFDYPTRNGGVYHALDYLGYSITPQVPGSDTFSRFSCPESKQQEVKGYTSFNNYGYNSFGWNLAAITALPLGLGGKNGGVGIGFIPTREAMVEAPSEMIAITDALRGDINAVAPDHWPTPRHHHNAQTLFCDGHIAGISLTNLVAPNNATRRHWQNDHQPHPEIHVSEP